MGILYSFGALVAWGVGDFLIQRSARKFGDWVALFYITLIGTIGFFPFVYKDLPALFSSEYILLMVIAAIVMVVSSYFNFEAFRVGKISVVEPIYAFEVAITAGLTSVFAKEYLTFTQGIFILVIVGGIILVSAKSLSHVKNIKWETGTMLAIAAMVGMGVVNFLFGIGARDANPLLIGWVSSVVTLLVSVFILARRGQLRDISADIKNNGALILSVSVISNIAWVFFFYAVLTIPIAVVTGISEGYIAIGVALGLIYNKEKLRPYQQIGLLFAIAGAIALAFVAKK